MGRARRLAAVAAAAVVAALTVAVPPAWAQELSLVEISGDLLDEPVVFTVADSPEECRALYREVDWLRGRRGDADPPKEEEALELLGPAYTMVVHLDGEPRLRYVLYPLAQGGPRVYRPEEQPGDRRAREAWFFGRLSMPETLAAAGIPVPGMPQRPSGGGEGGGSAEKEDPAESVLSAWREGLGATALVAVVLALGLGAVALLLRRRA